MSLATTVNLLVELRELRPDQNWIIGMNKVGELTLSLIDNGRWYEFALDGDDYDLPPKRLALVITKAHDLRFLADGVK